ncbi:ABC transporter permease [Clostridium fallax]|uniref:ABC-2 type transport system permease protein n=1 Tax=Clostridium fallax TaxID=1533 RepID=A0A1M4TVU9_9CLOT|nr:ABC transporter permease [Clostridium fallax]SHE48546.1 ABC-2 type transport system permease protein [Clostridium fallax]SQB22368.1 ABC-type polysaccharide/polyol phosphate export system, permease component [Clostridium fallax]
MTGTLKTIYAIGKKEVTEMIRYRDWIISLIIWPLIFPLMYILSALGLSGPDKSGLKEFTEITGISDYIGFIVIGAMVYMIVNLTMWNFGTFLRMEQQRGTLESLWICPIKRFNILLGGGVFNMLLSLLYVAVSMIEYSLIYNINFTGNIFQWVILFLVLIPGILGFGAAFASLVLWLKEANVAVMFARGLVMIFCGLSFPIVVMPQWMQYISKIFPFTFGINAAREVMLNNRSLFDVREDILWCLISGFIYFLIGRILFYFVEKKVKTEGSLERF